MALSRGHKILQALRDQQRLEELSYPNYESTKSTTENERAKVLKEYSTDVPASSDSILPTQGSRETHIHPCIETVPDTYSIQLCNEDRSPRKKIDFSKHSSNNEPVITSSMNTSGLGNIHLDINYGPSCSNVNERTVINESNIMAFNDEYHITDISFSGSDQNNLTSMSDHCSFEESIIDDSVENTSVNNITGNIEGESVQSSMNLISTHFPVKDTNIISSSDNYSFERNTESINLFSSTKPTNLNVEKSPYNSFENSNVDIAMFSTLNCDSINEDCTSLSPPSTYDSDKHPEYIPDRSDSSEISQDISDDNMELELRYEQQDVQHTKIYGNLSSQSSEVETISNDKTSNTVNLQNAAGKRVRNKDFCFFCENSVLNFARHIISTHSIEMEVQKIMSLPPKSSERKDLIASIRKRGNFIHNQQLGCQKPVRKPIFDKTTHLPCPHCLGYYSRTHLWRHKKKCKQNNENTKTTLAESQTLLINNLKVDSNLRDKVFPHMKPDDISLSAKQDPLICAFGSRYLKTHKQKHFVYTTSVKMRELARVVDAVRQINPNIKNMFEALKPENYDTIVKATKTITRYDEEKETFGAPTLAMNIAKSLKDCCGIAITEVLKKKFAKNSQPSSDIIEEFKTMIELIKCNWQYDVSGEAVSDLNMKKWNKITIIPLASDLKLFKEYLSQTSEEAANKLLTNPEDTKSYKVLLETVYCRVLVLNRRRPGELQRLLLEAYMKINNQASYEEFTDAISTSEKVLMKTFKRVVIRGKRGRGVPVLFAPDVSRHIDILLKARPGMFKKTENVYLFGLPELTTSLVGYKVLEKHAKASGVKNPKALTSTKLRKHLATITQILNMSPNDIEQLTMFMGHTENTHREVYRLPNDVYQTAKLGKLLLAMEDGSAAKYKGKSLSEIDIDMEEDLTSAIDEIDSDEGQDETLPYLTEGNKQPENKCLLEIGQKKPSKKRLLVPWSESQKTIVMDYFKEHIKKSQPPKRKECEELISLHPDILKNKSWLKIKVFVQNCYVKNKK